MRILHLCLSNFYIDGYSYQENALVAQNVADGHDVRVIASTEVFDEHRQLSYVLPSSYLGTDGAWFDRISYFPGIPHILARKLRIHRGVYNRIKEFNPDVILFHCACGAEIATAARYVRDNPHVKLYVDSHEDSYNSANSFISKWFLHYLYYRPILLRSMRYINRVLPVSVSCLEFMRDFYGVPEEKLEFYPLGGHVPDNIEYAEQRKEARRALNVPANGILIVQSGKFDKPKKLIESLRAFAQIPDERLQFVLVGHLYQEVEGEALELIQADSRVRFVGWKTSDELQALLCGADVYCQPGTQSATMQMAVSCRCAIILDDVASHKPYHKNNGWLVRDDADLKRALSDVSQSEKVLEMGHNSHLLALQMLDYRILAKRLYRSSPLALSR